MKRIKTWLASSLDLDTLTGVAWLVIVFVVIHAVVLSLPTLELLPEPSSLAGFASTLWQVHATMLAFTAIVITVVVTVVANQMYGRETWQLYRRASRFFPIICWNILALISHGTASLLLRPTSVASNSYEKISNIVLAEAIVFIIAIGLAIFLYWITLRFLDPDYVEDLSEREIERNIRGETIREFEHLQQVVRELNAEHQ